MKKNVKKNPIETREENFGFASTMCASNESFFVTEIIIVSRARERRRQTSERKVYLFSVITRPKARSFCCFVDKFR